MALAIEIAAASTGEIDMMAIIETIGTLALDLAYGLCPVETATSAFEFLTRRV